MEKVEASRRAFDRKQKKLSIEKPLPPKSNYVEVKPKRLIGFVVSILDTLNFDIDLEINSPLPDCYNRANSGNYSYFLANAPPETRTMRQSRAIRCHLKNLTLPRKEDENGLSAIGAATIFSITWICERDMMVGVEVSDIDIYNRVLVRIFDTNFKISLDEELRKRFKFPSYRSPARKISEEI